MRMNEASWAGIDADILARRILAAVAKVQAITRGTTRSALQQVRARYDRLRATGAFRLDEEPEEYWAGFRTLLRRRSFAAMASREAPAPMREAETLPDVRRSKGERRIEVDGVGYFWRVPPRATGAQEDLQMGMFALVRRADGTGPRFTLHFPQAHPDVTETPVPIRPADVAAAIRAIPAGKRRE